MRGYWNNPEATAEAFAGGWFHSGDLATRDAEGYLRLVDRKKDMIVSGGENIYPAEVERVLRDHPAVDDVAVVGFPHPRWGETPVAFVVGAEVEATELIEHCRHHLASYKKPSAIHVRRRAAAQRGRQGAQSASRQAYRLRPGVTSPPFGLRIWPTK